MKKILSVLFAAALVLVAIPSVGIAHHRQTLVRFQEGQVQLASSANRAATGGGTWTVITTTSRLHNMKSALFVLRTTELSGTAGDVLGVKLQTSADGGTTWEDKVYFPTIAGNSDQGHTQSHTAQWMTDIAPSDLLRSPAELTAAAADSVRQGPAGDQWRVVYTLGSSTTSSFKFGVEAYFKE